MAQEKDLWIRGKGRHEMTRQMTKSRYNKMKPNNLIMEFKRGFKQGQLSERKRIFGVMKNSKLNRFLLDELKAQIQGGKK